MSFGRLRELAGRIAAGEISAREAAEDCLRRMKELEPSLASLIMSFESVISALSGWLILGQVLRRREITGCVIMFAAILLAQSDTGE